MFNFKPSASHPLSKRFIYAYKCVCHRHRVARPWQDITCLHELMPLGTILRSLARRVEAWVVLLEVE